MIDKDSNTSNEKGRAILGFAFVIYGSVSVGAALE